VLTCGVEAEKIERYTLVVHRFLAFVETGIDGKSVLPNIGTREAT